MITSWLLGLPPLVVYGALFGLVAGESGGLPLPGETSLIAVGALASQHAGISICLDSRIVGDRPTIATPA